MCKRSLTAGTQNTQEQPLAVSFISEGDALLWQDVIISRSKASVFTAWGEPWGKTGLWSGGARVCGRDRAMERASDLTSFAAINTRRVKERKRRAGRRLTDHRRSETETKKTAARTPTTEQHQHHKGTKITPISNRNKSRSSKRTVTYRLIMDSVS